MQEVIFSSAAMWFLLGVIAHKFGSIIFGYGKISLFAKDIILNSLELLVSITHDTGYIQQLKYLEMQKAGASEETIKLAKEVDTQTINSWKHSIINKFTTTYPRELRGVVKFHTWSGALEFLTKELKKRYR